MHATAVVKRRVLSLVAALAVVLASGVVPAVAEGPDVSSATPSISGTPRVGSTLTAKAGSWTSGATLKYQWRADGKAISKATSKTFKPTTTQKGRRITVTVTGSKSGHTSVSKTSAATKKVILAPTPKVTGSAKLGSKLTVKRGTWTSGTKLKVQWYADNVAIPGATSTTFTVTTSQQGKKIFARVTGSRSGYPTVKRDSAVTKQVKLVDTSSKASVDAAYTKILLPALKKGTGWTGRTSSCKVGTESSSSRKATLDAVNFMRAMVQLDGVRFNSTWNKEALRNSLMMEARGEITHYPTKSGSCWSTVGADAAGRSNIALQWGGSLPAVTTGARGIVGYMVDAGSNNTVVGHRRWILEPSIAVMGTGSTNRASTLTVIGKSGLATSKYNAKPTWLEWPSAGYFPASIEPDGRWSLSASAAGADFSKAKVTVKTSSGRKLSVKKYGVVSYMGPETISFKVSGLSMPKGSAVATYTVSVTGIKGTSPSSYSYKVKLFNP